jgi:hypothetical protein
LESIVRVPSPAGEAVRDLVRLRWLATLKMAHAAQQFGFHQS